MSRERIKTRYPNCLVIFGGTQVPHDAVGYLERHPFIDLAVRAEGEEPFRDVLERYIDSRDFSDIPDVTWRDETDQMIVSNPGKRPQQRDLDIYPSPYLEGLYDQLLVDNSNMQFQAIIETNRGCPFLCTFCYWGKGGLSRKYRYFSIDRVTAEFEWFGRNKIGFVYNADSNFGMYRRDEEIAALMVATKEKYGYPEKVVNLYGKNTNERIFQIGKLLSDAGMHKGMGLSRQSMNPHVLENIKRSNIKLSVYQTLQERFEAAGVAVFSELIIGLPGETYESFGEGIDQLLSTSFNCNLIIVLCEIYPNTEMADPDYLKKFGVITRTNRNVGVHSKVGSSGAVTEFIPYVVGTDTMSTASWRRTCKMSWTAMALTGMRLGYHLMQYLADRYGTRHIDFIRFLSEGAMRANSGQIWREELAHYDAFLEQILAGQGRAVELPQFGDIYWAIEEATFLRATEHLDCFYQELLDITAQFLGKQGVAFDAEELADVVRFQRLCIPSAAPLAQPEQSFVRNIPEYFEARAAGRKIAIGAASQRLVVKEVDYECDKVRFAQEKLLWARRGGKFAAEFSWYDTATFPPQTHDMVKTSSSNQQV